MKLTSSNMLSSGVSLTTNKAATELVNKGTSLTSGKNSEIDVSSFFISNNLLDSVNISKNVLESMSYGSNAVKTGLGSIESMINTVTTMINTVNQAGNLTGNAQALNSLNTILSTNLGILNQNITSTNFNGTKLFDGTLGGNAILEPKYNVTPVNIKTIGPLGGIFAATGTGTKGVNTLTVDIANLASGDKLTIGDVTFTFVTTVPDNSGTQIEIGTTDAETASNIATAIVNSSDLSTKAYNVTTAGADVIITQRSASSNQIRSNYIGAAAGITTAFTTAGIGASIDLSGISNFTGLIGSNIGATVTATWTNGAAANTAFTNVANRGYPVANTPAVNAGDTSAILQISIAGRTFVGGVALPTGSTSNTVPMIFTDRNTNETIRINFVNAQAIDITTLVNAQNNLATPLQNLINGSIFAQTMDLDINTSAGNVVFQGNTIASMKGMTAQLNATDVNDLEFEDFKISGANNGDLTFTATVKNITTGISTVYTSAVVTNANIVDLVQGSSISLTNLGDTLTLNLGELGLTKLQNQPTYYAPVANAIKNALTNAGSGLNVRTGVAFDDSLVVKMPNVTLGNLMVDNNGSYLQTFDVSTQAGQQKASEVLTNALNSLRTGQVGLKSSGDAINLATNALENLIQITQDAADSFTNADLIATAEAFSEALKSLASAILVLKGGSTIAQQAQQIIANVVN